MLILEELSQPCDYRAFPHIFPTISSHTQTGKVKEIYMTYPYRNTTAPSSNACLTVIYPPFPSDPLLKTANFSSKFRSINGSSANIGITISETKDVTREVNAAASLRL